MYLDYIQLTILAIGFGSFYLISIYGAYRKGRSDEYEEYIRRLM